MVFNSSIPIINGGLNLSSKTLSFTEYHQEASGKLEFGGLHNNTQLALKRTRSRAIRVLANPNASPRKERVRKEVFMVDPLEAKRLAAKQMEEIKSRERFERRRKIEAINGAWAMIGLTAGLIIEGQTGQSIPSQLVGYFYAVIGIFVR